MIFPKCPSLKFQKQRSKFRKFYHPCINNVNLLPPLRLLLLLSLPWLIFSETSHSKRQSPPPTFATNLYDSDLHLTVFEILVAARRTSSGKPLTTANYSPNSQSVHRSLTSTAAGKMKKASGLKSPGSGSKNGRQTNYKKSNHCWDFEESDEEEGFQ